MELRNMKKLLEEEDCEEKFAKRTLTPEGFEKWQDGERIIKGDIRQHLLD